MGMEVQQAGMIFPFPSWKKPQPLETVFSFRKESEARSVVGINFNAALPSWGPGPRWQALGPSPWHPQALGVI